ncbi:hypothetical protein P7K49_020002 [Saguinus oedipus]|uniref:Uncharacterized protein n=1 Tax=Saguinus oedipus TaxID=9490 RepID=A0ABQ9UZ47_SAGOE|nr:hypothetical protein P7K49_020002 [Saguinus oedipus]
MILYYIALQKESQEGIPLQTQNQEPLKPQENVSRPIHNPLVLKTNFEEEEEIDEQNDASSLWTKTPEEIEEKRAIKEMCYKSGEYYKFHTPPDISSSKSVASTAEKESEKPLESGSELQEGDSLTVPTKFSQYERQGGIKSSLHRKPGTDIAASENGEFVGRLKCVAGGSNVREDKASEGKKGGRLMFLGVDENEALMEEKEINISKCSNTKDNKDSPHPKRSLTTRLVSTTHVLNATENISMKCREDPSSTVQTPSPQNKMSYHRNNKNRNTENASYVHVQRDAVRSVSLNAPPRSRPTQGSYNKVHVNKEPKPNLSPVDFSPPIPDS